MPTTRLFPAATDTSGSDLPAFGVSPQHVALSDANDGTGVTRQLSSTETSRHCFGGPITQLPASSGIIKQVTLGVRGLCDTNLAQRVGATMGPYSITQTYTNVLTTYTSVLAPPAGGFPAFAAMMWDVRHEFINTNGAASSTVELWLDVEWYPVTGVQILQIY
jgi:hypothetical protein